MRPNAQGDGWRLKWCGMNVDTEISRVRMQMMTGTGSHFRDKHTNRYKSYVYYRIISVHQPERGFHPSTEISFDCHQMSTTIPGLTSFDAHQVVRELTWAKLHRKTHHVRPCPSN